MGQFITFRKVPKRLSTRRTIAAVVVALAMALITNAPCAMAQGTMGMLPGPISTVELDGYAQRLRVSAQQRRAMDAIHDQYKQEFRSLRENEIAEFMKKMRDMDGAVMPDRKRIQEFMSQMENLSRRIASLDHRFFDQLQSTLTDDQLAMLPRVRLARQRGRMHEMQLMWMGTERPADLSELAFAMDWPEQDRAAITELLGPYETSLTSSMEKMHDAAMSTIVGIYDAMEKLGVNEQTAQDPEQMEKVGEAVQQVWQGMMVELNNRARDIVDLNDRTLRTAMATVSPEAGRQFRDRYYRRAYAEAAFAMYPHDYVFAPALKRDDLTDAQRQEVIAARDLMLQSLDATLERAIQAVREWRSSMSMFQYDQTKAEAFQRRLGELRDQADRARDTANASLEASLGKELLDKIGRIKSVSHPEELAMLENGMDGEQHEDDLDEDDGDSTFDDVGMGVDQFVPAAMTVTDVADFAALLEMSEDQRQILNQLHARYLTTFVALGEKEFSALQKVTTTMWSWDDANQVSRGPTAEKIAEAYKLRVAAFEAVVRVDEEFFSEVELAVLTPEQVPHMTRVRQLRERARYNRNAYYWDSNEGSIDVSRLVRRQRTQFSSERWPAVDAILVRYEQESLPLFKSRYDATIGMQKAQEMWQVEMTTMQAEGDHNNVRMGMRYQELMRGPQQSLADVSKSLGALNRETIDQIEQLLSAEAAHTIRDEYNRQAYPNVYDDGSSMQKSLLRARALPDLSPQQAQQLTEIAAEYQPAYTAVCEQMVESSVDRSMLFATFSEDGEDAAEWQRREETLAKLRFDRAELNARAAGRIRTILTAEQIQSIGGLPTVERPSEFDF